MLHERVSEIVGRPVSLDSRHSDHPAQVDVLWADWHEKNVNFDAYTASMSGQEVNDFYDLQTDLELRIERSDPCAMRAAAAALCELWHETSDNDEKRTPAVLIESKVRDDLGRLSILVLQALRPSLSGRIRQVVDDLCDGFDRPLRASLLQRGFSRAPLLQAAE